MATRRPLIDDTARDIIVLIVIATAWTTLLPVIAVWRWLRGG